MISKNLTRPLALLIFEGALVYSCGVMAIYIRFGPETPYALGAGRVWLKTLLVTVLVLASFYLFDLYDFSRIRRRAALLLRLSQSLVVGGLALAMMFYVWPQIRLGRGVFPLSLLLTLAFMVAWRFLARRLLGHPRLAHRVLILGVGHDAVTIAREMLMRREAGYDVIGFVGDDPAQIGKSLINPSVVGVMSDLEAVVGRHRPDRIVIAIPYRRGRMPLDLLLKLKVRDGVTLDEADAFYEKLTGKIVAERLRLWRLVFADASRWAHLYRRARRLVDVALASVIGLLTSPLMLLTALAIKLDSRVTRLGRCIRKRRIDELPQLFNIIRGEMSLIGPRPERPVFVKQLEQRIPYYSER